MKKNDLKDKFQEFANEFGYGIDQSHFENGYGSKYILAKEGSIFLDWADARIGRYVRISVNGGDGTVSKLTHNMKIPELYAYMNGAIYGKLHA